MDWPYFLPAAATCAALTTQAIDTQFCLKYHASIMSLSASLGNPQSRQPPTAPLRLIFDNKGQIGWGRARRRRRERESHRLAQALARLPVGGRKSEGEQSRRRDKERASGEGRDKEEGRKKKIVLTTIENQAGERRCRGPMHLFPGPP